MGAFTVNLVRGNSTMAQRRGINTGAFNNINTSEAFWNTLALIEEVNNKKEQNRIMSDELWNRLSDEQKVFFSQYADTDTEKI